MERKSRKRKRNFMPSTSPSPDDYDSYEEWAVAYQEFFNKGNLWVKKRLDRLWKRVRKNGNNIPRYKHEKIEHDLLESMSTNLRSAEENGINGHPAIVEVHAGQQITELTKDEPYNFAVIAKDEEERAAALAATASQIVDQEEASTSESTSQAATTTESADESPADASLADATSEEEEEEEEEKKEEEEKEDEKEEKEKEDVPSTSRDVSTPPKKKKLSKKKATTPPPASATPAATKDGKKAAGKRRSKKVEVVKEEEEEQDSDVEIERDCVKSVKGPPMRGRPKSGTLPFSTADVRREKSGEGVVKTLVIGNTSTPTMDKKKRDKDGFSHTWKVYVKGEVEIVSSVQFNLHHSYEPDKIRQQEPPFIVRKSGWGEFELLFYIHFKDDKLHPLLHSHRLRLDQGHEGGVESAPFERQVKITVHPATKEVEEPKSAPTNDDGSKDDDKKDGSKDDNKKDGSKDDDKKDGSKDDNKKDGSKDDDKKDGLKDDNEKDGSKDDNEKDGLKDDDKKDGSKDDNEKDGLKDDDKKDGSKDDNKKDGSKDDNKKDGSKDDDKKDGLKDDNEKDGLKDDNEKDGSKEDDADGNASKDGENSNDKDRADCESLWSRLISAACAYHDNYKQLQNNFKSRKYGMRWPSHEPWNEPWPVPWNGSGKHASKDQAAGQCNCLHSANQVESRDTTTGRPRHKALRETMRYSGRRKEWHGQKRKIPGLKKKKEKNFI